MINQLNSNSLKLIYIYVTEHGNDELEKSPQRESIGQLVAKVGTTPLQIITRVSYLCLNEIVPVRHPFFQKRFNGV